jgi:hypothetical protein
MHVADLVIDRPQQQLEQLVRTYECALDLDNMLVTAESKFEQDCLALAEDGWRLKLVSHLGSIVLPRNTVVARYEKE